MRRLWESGCRVSRLNPYVHVWVAILGCSGPGVSRAPAPAPHPVQTAPVYRLPERAPPPAWHLACSPPHALAPHTASAITFDFATIDLLPDARGPHVRD